MTRWIGSIALTIGLAAFGVACSTGNPATPSPVATGSVTSIAVSGTAPVLGSTSQFSAVATMSDGSKVDVSSVATWQSSNTADATVSPSGMVSGLAAGSVTITATFGSVTGSDQITLAAS